MKYKKYYRYTSESTAKNRRKARINNLALAILSLNSLQAEHGDFDIEVWKLRSFIRKVKSVESRITSAVGDARATGDALAELGIAKMFKSGERTIPVNDATLTICSDFILRHGVPNSTPTRPVGRLTIKQIERKIVDSGGMVVWRA